MTTFVEEFYDDDDDDDDGAKAWTALAKTTWTSGVLLYCSVCRQYCDRNQENKLLMQVSLSHRIINLHLNVDSLLLSFLHRLYAQNDDRHWFGICCLRGSRYTVLSHAPEVAKSLIR